MSSSATTTLLPNGRVEWVESLRTKYGVPGIAFAVVKGPQSPPAAVHSAVNGEDPSPSSGWTTQIETFGTRNSRGDAFEKDTLFAIASNSKVFASLAVSLLIERKTKLPNGRLLTWRTKAKDVLGDDWVVPDEYATSHADLNDLAGMRLGMSTHHFGKMPINPPMAPAQQLRLLRHMTMSSELRQQFAYDSNCYVALSHMVPTLTGIPYHTFLQEEFFKPLGMSSTFCDSNAARASNRTADGFLRKGSNREGRNEAELLGEPKPVGWWTQDHGFWCLAAGGVSMSIDDGAKLIREFLSPEHLPANVINSRAEPITPTGPAFPLRIDGPQSLPSYGRGQVIDKYRGHTVVWHTGNLPGHATLILCIPSAQVGIVTAINDGTIGGAFHTMLRNQLLDDLLGLAPTEDYEAKFLKPAIQALTQPPAAPLSTGPIATAHASWAKMGVGSYYHPGYMAMHLRQFDKNAADSDAIIAIARQKNWFYAFDSTCLIAAPMNKMWLSHLLFRPLPSNVQDGDDAKVGKPYEWNAFQVYPIVGKDGKPLPGEFVATLLCKGSAVFTQRGIGMFGNFKDPLAGPLPLDEEIVGDVTRAEQEAEVWFARVS